MKNRLHLRVAVVLITAGLVLPILLTTMLFTSTPSIAPAEAARLLLDPKENAILVDVRPEKEFAAFSLRGTTNFPLGAAMAGRPTQDTVLAEKKKLFVICDTGLSGAWATRSLRKKGYLNAMNVQGGMDAWLTDRSALIDKTVLTTRGETGGIVSLPVPLFDQIVITLAAFVLKPLYQLLSIFIIFVLWKRQEVDLASIKWATLAFLVGENACASNYLFFDERSLLMEYLHMYGMLMCFGLAVYALLEAIDKRLLHFSDRDAKCALFPLCGRCYKYSDARCNVRSFILLLIPATMVTAAIPLSASLESRYFETEILGSATIFGHPVVYQFLEARIYPVVALFLFSTALIALLRLRENGFAASKIYFAMGMGPLGFSFLRFVFYWGYQDNPLWADAWEEITEFLFIVILVWIVLRVRAASTQSIGYDTQQSAAEGDHGRSEKNLEVRS